MRVLAAEMPRLAWWGSAIGLLFVTLQIGINASDAVPHQEKQQITAPQRKKVPGQRYHLAMGELFVPDYFRMPPSNKVDVVVFFHGAAWCAEQTFYEGRKNAALVSISAKDYQKEFSDRTRFQRILNEVTAKLEALGEVRPGLGKVCLASFSGGYAAVREILKTLDYYKIISDVLLADSLYCSVKNQGSDNPILDENQMAPFLKFAKDAGAGRKHLWFTQLYPPDEKYRNNTTTLTASYLIAHLGGRKKPENSINKLGMQLLYSCDVGGFHVRGYSGMTSQDHFNHFYNMGEYYKKLSL